MYYRNAQSALVVYDITKPTSLIKARHWVAELQRQASPGIVIALVGNKVDLTNEDSAAAEDGPAHDEEGADEGTGGGVGGAGGAEEVGGEGDARKVSTKEGKEYAEEEGLLFFETSAKTGLNVQEVFTAIANAIPETQMKGARGASGGAGGTSTALRQGPERVNLTGPRRESGPKDGCAC